jgi:hypothetical protein
MSCSRTKIPRTRRAGVPFLLQDARTQFNTSPRISAIAIAHCLRVPGAPERDNLTTRSREHLLIAPRNRRSAFDCFGVIVGARTAGRVGGTACCARAAYGRNCKANDTANTDAKIRFATRHLENENTIRDIIGVTRDDAIDSAPGTGGITPRSTAAVVTCQLLCSAWRAAWNPRRIARAGR